MNKVRSIKIFIAAIAAMLSVPASSQSPYHIDITKQEYTLNTGFVKTGSNRSPQGETFSYNNMYLIKNGRPWFPVMGEMHFSRCEEKDWEASILKMKACGIEIISTYIFWNHTEQTEGVYNWTGNNNLHKFLSLCKKHGMYVWLRPGPWVHAEARYGGFPDWLMNKHTGLRKNDTAYLRYTNHFFKETAEQCDGFLFKQSGTIIGIQIENELVFKDSALYAHMKTIKQLAVNAGFDVPYYSAFAQGPDDQDEFLYMIGAYPDSPWALHTHKMYKPVFFIKPLESDSDIGADLFGKADNRVRNTYPKLSAELGAGMQPTYHRRVAVSAKDVGAVAFTKIASGLNGLCYYMFHGGLNPTGKTGLQESRATGYPNDVPLINYDFQAPVGSMGIIAESYDELKLQHLFLKDYGAALCTQKTFFPTQRVQTYFSYDTVQASVRVHGNSGFIFLSNYQRFVNLPAVDNFQLHLATAKGEENIPEKPVRFPSNSYTVWPYNLQMKNIVLHYATAQPLCILNNANAATYVFFTNDDAEFVFDNLNIKNCDVVVNSSVSKEEKSLRIITTGNKTSIFSITTKDNKKINVLVLTRSLALRATKIKTAAKELLLMSNADIFFDDKKLILEHVSDTAEVMLSAYPSIKIKASSALLTIKKETGFSLYDDYRIYTHLQPKADVHITEDSNSPEQQDSQLYKDSILKHYSASASFNKQQPGPLYQLKFHHLPGEHLYNLQFKTPVNAVVKSWIADFNYQADVMALYKNDSLVYDQFNYNNHCNYKLSARLKPGEKWKLQLLPFQSDFDVYVEDDMQLQKNKEWQKAVLKAVTLKPAYRYELVVQ